jgi:hypothetical protein
MALTSTSTFAEARTAYYANRDYDTGNGDALEFRRACELVLELTPAKSGDRDGEVEMDLSHVRKQLERVNAYIDTYLAEPPAGSTRRRVTYLRPVRG